jgi:hypothetical protein
MGGTHRRRAHFRHGHDIVGDYWDYYYEVRMLKHGTELSIPSRRYAAEKESKQLLARARTEATFSAPINGCSFRVVRRWHTYVSKVPWVLRAHVHQRTPHRRRASIAAPHKGDQHGLMKALQKSQLFVHHTQACSVLSQGA